MLINPTIANSSKGLYKLILKSPVNSALSPICNFPSTFFTNKSLNREILNDGRRYVQLMKNLRLLKQR